MQPDYESRRTKALVEAQKSYDCNAFLVTHLTNIRYLTGFTGSNAALILRPSGDVLATDDRYAQQVSIQCPDIEAVIDRKTVEVLVRADERTAFESDHVSVSQHQSWSSLTSLVPCTSIVETLRLSKDESEHALIAKACVISDAALADLIPQITIGMTERSIARRLENLMFDHGADGISFATIVATGPNSAMPHHEPDATPVRSGDFIVIDFGALVGGYHADETRTLIAGDPADWQLEIYTAVQRAQEAGRNALQAGAESRDVDSSARQIITDAGYGEFFGHGLGHGVGLDIHEAPIMGARATGTIPPDSTITVEPGIYLPGRGGVRIEDTCRVSADGALPLTTTARDLIIVG